MMNNMGHEKRESMKLGTKAESLYILEQNLNPTNVNVLKHRLYKYLIKFIAIIVRFYNLIHCICEPVFS